MLTKILKTFQKNGNVKFLRRNFTVYSNQHFRHEETYGRKTFRYDYKINDYSDPIKVYLERRRLQKEEICI